MKYQIAVPMKICAVFEVEAESLEGALEVLRSSHNDWLLPIGDYDCGTAEEIQSEEWDEECFWSIPVGEQWVSFDEMYPQSHQEYLAGAKQELPL